jgi:site-specific recombinase XerD
MMAATSRFVSAIADRITQFLEHKRVLGRRYQTEAYALRLFDRYLVEHSVSGVGTITPELIDAFVTSRPRGRPRSFNHLIGVLRRLFNWLVARDVIARSPVRTSVRRGGDARIPFIFSPEQARQLLHLAARLPDVPGTELRGPTFHALFATLYGLGLRVSEVCRLDVGDLDRRRRLLVVRDTKFDKDRLVPFGPRVGAMLDHYVLLRRAQGHDLADGQPLFSAYAGRRMRRHRIGGVFRLLRPRLDLDLPTGASPPRVHDLRHSFAVRTLLRWYRTGINPTERLLHLSTFLGHVQPESTSVYLTITADLLSEAGGRFEAFAQPLVSEVRR